MNPFKTIQKKTTEARAKESIRPLLESRMMRDIIMEIGQRGVEPLDLQSVPLEKREQVIQAEAENGLAGLKQCIIDEVVLDACGITLHIKEEAIPFLYASYNYENIENTNYLPAVAESLVQRMMGYYDMHKTNEWVSKEHGSGHRERIAEVVIRRHHEDTPFDHPPVQKRKLF